MYERKRKEERDEERMRQEREELHRQRERQEKSDQLQMQMQTFQMLAMKQLFGGSVSGNLIVLPLWFFSFTAYNSVSTAGLSSSQVITSNEASCSINKSSGSEKQFWALFGTYEDDSDSYSFELKVNNIAEAKSWVVIYLWYC